MGRELEWVSKIQTILQRLTKLEVARGLAVSELPWYTTSPYYLCSDDYYSLRYSQGEELV